MAAPNILCDTAGMTNAQWLAARMHGPSGKIPYTVGGSDVATVFGVSPWTTPLELWMIKKGRMKQMCIRDSLAALCRFHHIRQDRRIFCLQNLGIGSCSGFGHEINEKLIRFLLYTSRCV